MIDDQTIDNVIISNTTYQWRKIARVVGSTMINLEKEGSIQGLNDMYLTERVIHLVEKGILESQGDLSQMRFSEVRLTK